jgi:hypothetical protein
LLPLIEGGPLHVKRRDALPDGTVADFVERTCSASGYKSEGDVEARSFVHGTNSIFTDGGGGGASSVVDEAAGAEDYPLAAGSVAPSSLGDDATLTTTTMMATQSNSSVIQDVIVKDGSDSTGIILGGDLLGSDYDNSRGKKYSRTVSLPAHPAPSATTRVLVFGSAEVAWAVAARHEGSVGRFLKTAARTASHTGLTALKDEAVEALAVACKRRELVRGLVWSAQAKR